MDGCDRVQVSFLKASDTDATSTYSDTLRLASLGTCSSWSDYAVSSHALTVTVILH